MDFNNLFYDNFATRELPPAKVLEAGIRGDVKPTTAHGGSGGGGSSGGDDDGDDDDGGDPPYVVFPPLGAFPYFYQRSNQEQVARNGLVPVYSCWNGMVAFAGRPFAEQRGGLAFRALLPERQDSMDYSASECCLVFSDLARLGYHGRTYVNPNVRVTYHPDKARWADYYLPLLNWIWFRWLPYPVAPAPGSPLYASQREAWSHAKHDGVSVLDRICVQSRNHVIL